MGGNPTPTQPMPSSGMSPIQQQQMERLQRTTQNPLYRFGSALAGRDPVGDQLARLQQQQMQQQRMDMAQQQEQRAAALFPAQMQQIQQALLKGGLDTLTQLQTFGAGLPDDKREELYNLATPGLTQMFQFGAAQDKTVQSMVSPDLVKFLLRSPGAQDALVSSLPHLTDADKRTLSAQAKTGDYAKVITAAKELSSVRQKENLAKIQSKVAAAIPTTGPAASFTDALRVLSPEERQSVMTWIGSTPASEVDQVLQSMNVIPLGVEREKLKMEAAAQIDNTKIGNLGPDFVRFSRELYGPDMDPRRLTDDQSKAVNERIKAEKEGVAFAGGAAAVRVKEQTRLSPKERADTIHVPSLEKNLDLVQPPAGTTLDQLKQSSDYADITDKQKGQVSGLKKTRIILDSLFTLADRAIIAERPEQALIQRGQAPTEAFLKTNPAVAAYNDAKKTFLGNLSRELGSERGVLTEQDIARIAGGLPDFSDTTTTRDIKKGIVNDIWNAARQATVSEISGKPTQASRKTLDDLLSRLDQVSKGSASKTMTKIRRLSDGKVFNLAPGYPVPQGFEGMP